MEYQGSVPMIVLKVTNICCRAYQKKLKKELSKLDGVYAIDINPEKSLVSIRGKVDINLLLRTISRTGKHAEIVRPDKKKDYENPKSDSHHYHKNSYHRENNRHKFEEEEKEEHICEDYVPPLVDERICRDYYCKDHRTRPIIRDRMHPSAYYSQGHFGPFPNYHHRARRPIVRDPRWWGMDEPPRPWLNGGFGNYGGGCIIM